jgi:hypothetical protein
MSPLWSDLALARAAWANAVAMGLVEDNEDAKGQLKRDKKSAAKR